ncbi:MAG: proline--tRNA ligase [Anaerolineaceae bacterium]|jgi:prolyl-tRNA synthetase|nr:MAG: proline--tRNA ligase [Anaerolineaceae bacterium]
MRLSQLFNQTLRKPPDQNDVAGHQFLIQAGYLRPLASGIFGYLPLAQRTLANISKIIREEMDAIGGQEVSLPVVHPAEIWQETGRWYSINEEMGRFKDRSGRDMVLAMTHEEAVAAVTRDVIQSYRQLPALIYQLQTKWRDDPRSRAGLIRAREFTMLDSYSLDRDESGLDSQYQAHFQAYSRIFDRCSLPVMAIKSDTGMMGGTFAHEFMYLNPIGEDTIILCSSCGYAANRQIARIQKSSSRPKELKSIEKVATPEKKTIADLVNYLNIPADRTAKAVFMMAEIEGAWQLVLALLRGDLELNETKLSHVINAAQLRPALEDEIKASGAVPGYASPIGLKNTLVVVDDEIPNLRNLTAGANEAGYHLINVNYGRDFKADILADIVCADQGLLCPECGKPLTSQRGVEVGNIFKLGTFYSERMGCRFLDEDGASKPVVMGSYGIGLGRLMSCIAEEHHDEKGLAWPAHIAPYSIYLIHIEDKTGETRRIAESLYAQLIKAGLQALYDDRDTSPGVKFNDADLLGMPLRLTISARSLSNGGIEIKSRSSEVAQVIDLDRIIEYLVQIQSEF